MRLLASAGSSKLLIGTAAMKHDDASMPGRPDPPKGFPNDRRRFLLGLAFWVFVELPLMITFGAGCVAYGVQTIYRTYYVPLMDRATRTNFDLMHEHTYYHRKCTERDISTHNLSQLVLHEDMDTAADDAGADLLMTHGALVIPELLRPSTVQQLREYAILRNRMVAPHEEYPVSQGKNRISFGYDATEHPAVVQAIQEVSHHPVLQKLLQRVLGDIDPASTEITTITQYFGAPKQAWHSDTKEDGNALKFARTYTHSYSLFLPLQNTTKAMGATDICPGTHYCANDLSDVCERASGTGIHTAHPSRVFQAGDGALINQHVWHRGGSHTDRHAPERVVFIMSFVARPGTSNGDTRQLARGTYFHQKWNMWGHTWRDLQSPMKYMAWPWSALKCLSLYTSPQQNWGYDLVTATYMRFSNGQLGSDLTRLVHIWDDVLKWPSWLHGPNREYLVSEKQAWQDFIQGTIQTLQDFIVRIAIAVHALYLATCLVSWGVLKETRRLSWRRMTIRRVCWSHLILAALTWGILHRIQTSPWGRSVVQGRTLQRPFPPVVFTNDEEMQTISKGPTTYPSTWDVLLGTRFDAPWLGSYERWLDRHPGNAHFQSSLQRNAAMLNDAPGTANQKGGSGYESALRIQIRDAVLADVRAMGGRFLQQDYRTGDWRIMTVQEVQHAMELELASVGTSLQPLRIHLDRTIATLRFGTTLRSTVLARTAAVQAWKLQQTLLRVSRHRIPPMSDDAEPKRKKTNISISNFRLPSRNIDFVVSQHTHNLLPGRVRSIGLPQQPNGAFRVGVPVWYLEEDGVWYRGDILAVDEDGMHTVAFETGEVYEMVPIDSLVPYQPVQEGDYVMGCFLADSDENEEDEDKENTPISFALDDCFPGIVLRVMPDEAVAIVYGDGDYEFRVPRNRYFIPPFVHFPLQE